MIVRKQRGRLTALLFVFFLSAASVAAYAADGSTAMSDMEEAGEETGMYTEEADTAIEDADQGDSAMEGADLADVRIHKAQEEAEGASDGQEVQEEERRFLFSGEENEENGPVWADVGKSYESGRGRRDFLRRLFDESFYHSGEYSVLP